MTDHAAPEYSAIYMLRIAVVAVLASCSAASTSPTASVPTAPSTPSAPRGGSPFERFASMTPAVGQEAPRFELQDSTGVTVKLAEATARGPVVLVWGSFT